MKKYWKMIAAVTLVVAVAVTVSLTSVNWKMRATDDGGDLGDVDVVEQDIVLDEYTEPVAPVEVQTEAPAPETEATPEVQAQLTEPVVTEADAEVKENVQETSVDTEIDPLAEGSEDETEESTEAESTEAVQKKIKIKSSLEKYSEVADGTECRLEAELTGFDDEEYTIKWYSSEDGNKWDEILHEDGNVYEFTITADNSGYQYKIEVEVKDDDDKYDETVTVPVIIEETEAETEAITEDSSAEEITEEATEEEAVSEEVSEEIVEEKDSEEVIEETSEDESLETQEEITETEVTETTEEETSEDVTETEEEDPSKIIRIECEVVGGGKAKIGSQIRIYVVTEGFDEDAVLTYQWLCDNGTNGEEFTEIKGATDSSYIYTITDENKTFQFKAHVEELKKTKSETAIEDKENVKTAEAADEAAKDEEKEQK